MPTTATSITTFVLFVKIFVSLIDVVMYPIYFFIDKPWKFWQRHSQKRSKVVTDDDVWETAIEPEIKVDIRILSTITEAIEKSIHRNNNKRCYGYRKLIAIEHRKSEGPVKKMLENRYTWLSYEEVNDKMLNVMYGLSNIGVSYLDKVVLIMETRMEFYLVSFSIFRLGGTLCTMFSTLGVDAYVHGINELENEIVITNFDNAKKLLSISSKIPTVKKLIVVLDEFGPTINELPLNHAIEVLEWRQVENLGRRLRNANDVIVNNERNVTTINFHSPQPNDLALIMYTSGTTGVPKGVQFTQRSLAQVFVSYSVLINRVPKTNVPDNVYLSYMPAAHMFEFMVGSAMFQAGVPIGFATPFTVFEEGLHLANGSLPDIKLLNPTIMIAVPLVMERLNEKITAAMSKKPILTRQLIQFFVDYKTRWTQRGFNTPFVNHLLFNKIHDHVLGKRLNCIIVAGAPFRNETQSFLRTVLNVDIVQGYGTTETSASAIIQDSFNNDGNVGYPVDGVKVMLRDLIEEGFTTKDKPYPRGELIVGAHHNSFGYYNRPQETEENFFTKRDEDSRIWFVTGDIVEVNPNRGTFKMIDRKKDLIKLANGEFVSLGKVESILKENKFVESIVVIVPSVKNFVVAVVLPNKDNVGSLVKQVGVSADDVCRWSKVKNEILSTLRKTAFEQGLSKIETPRNVLVVPDDWTPESGLVTASMKVRRQAIRDYYKDDIEKIVAEVDL